MSIASTGACQIGWVCGFKALFMRWVEAGPGAMLDHGLIIPPLLVPRPGMMLSSRDTAQVSTEVQQQLPCPRASALAAALATQQVSGVQALFDLAGEVVALRCCLSILPEALRLAHPSTRKCRLCQRKLFQWPQAGLGLCARDERR